MNHGRQRWLGGIGLALAAILIWGRDTRWMTAPADTLPLALGLPLAYVLGRPWQLGTHPLSPSMRILAAVGGIVFAGGWIIGNLTLLALSWTWLAIIWVKGTFTSQARRGRLAWVLLLSFPWLVLEWQGLGWAYRLSSATVAEQIFRLMQLPTQRAGTLIEVLGVPISIEASCAGWNLLQLTLLAGVALGTQEIRSTRRFALLLCLIPGIAWLANLLRILILSGIALSCDAEAASGAIHGLTGLVILGAVLFMTKGLCFLLNPPPQTTSRMIKAP